MSKISDARLDEMLAGLEGVTPGPWVSIHHSGPGSEIRQTDTDPTNKHHWPFRIAQTISGQTANVDRVNFDHLARCQPDTMREILLLAKSALRSKSEAVGVKALEWQDFEDNRVASVSRTSVCNIKYEIYRDVDAFEPVWPGSNGDMFPTIEAAKAAAQSDYDRRIFSALTHPAPAAVVSDEMVERACKSTDPLLFSGDAQTEHMAASPYKVEHMQYLVRTKVRAALVAALTEEGAPSIRSALNGEEGNG